LSWRAALRSGYDCAVDINNINHVGMAIRDLAATTERYEAMGFQLTPYSPHSAAWKPGEHVQPLGSGNRCIMFMNTYLEILASEDAAKPAPRIANFLNRHQGAHIICFDCGDCDFVDKRVRGLGIETSGVIPLQRDIETPDGVRTAKFERTQFAPKASPEGYIQASRHLTPEYIYQPRYIRHPNGCFQFAETILIADDLTAFERRYRDYLNVTPAREGNLLRFRLPLGTTLTLVDFRHAPAMLPGTLLPPIPGIGAVGFRTGDLKGTRDRLKANNFTVVEIGGRILVPAEEASGVALIFGE
jgi:catechol 2,3-dioxygenase-like lactoylglutathione lyase family enzyme